MERKSRIPGMVAAGVLTLIILSPAMAQYGGGTGEPNDPYQIRTAEQMNAIGTDPSHWNMCYKLMADIDLSAYDGQNGHPAFTAIGSWSSFPRGADPPIVRCSFDGNDHTISNLTLTSGRGLFSTLDYSGVIKNLTLLHPVINSASTSTGALVGFLYGTITNCHVVDGVVTGTDYVGGLAGQCEHFGYARIVDCHATGIVTGNDYVGGLVGSGPANRCFAAATVVGRYYVGGLTGNGSATNCYATGAVIGTNYVGGLAGVAGDLANCYATGIVIGSPSPRDTVYVGGLAGHGYSENTAASFWDIETSGQGAGVCGEGRTTAQMQTVGTFLDWGAGDHAGVWTIDEGRDYPHLAWEPRPGMPIGPLQFSDLAVGTGTADDPYLISTPLQLYLLTKSSLEWDKHFKLTADLNMTEYAGKGLSGIGAPCPPFTGIFDGNGHTISKYARVSATGDYYGGFFGRVEGPSRDDRQKTAVIKNLGLIGPLITGQTQCAGALAGSLGENGVISGCYVDGGLVMDGKDARGGMVGENAGTIKDCFASVSVSGGSCTGGLVGRHVGTITNCYSTGLVQAGTFMGGLVGAARAGKVTASFWDIETSGQTASDGGTDLTTARMQTGSTFIDAGWDFVGETANGTADLWRIDDGKGYPRLSWEKAK
jgi:trimeric autotransporter adhesin